MHASAKPMTKRASVRRFMGLVLEDVNEIAAGELSGDKRMIPAVLVGKHSVGLVILCNKRPD